LLSSLIFKKQHLGEADELVVFLSREMGWLTGVAKNSRKSRVRFAGNLETLSLVDLTVKLRKKDDRVWIEESQVIRGFLPLRQSILKVGMASYFTELASLFLPEGQQDSNIFDFLVNFFSFLETYEPSPVNYLLHEILLLRLLGYEPRFDCCAACGSPLKPGIPASFSVFSGGVCHRSCLKDGENNEISISPETLALVRRGLQLDIEAVRRLRLHKKGIAELRVALSAFVRHLRGRDIKSLLFLEGIQSLLIEA
jgi:DNA repair protein RecO (recombination protein O)